MQIRLGPLALLAVVAFVWWLLTPSQRAVAPVAASAGRSVVADASRCPLPPIVEAGEAPLQSAIQPGIALPDVDGARLTSLAGFSVRARVLSRERYHFGREADYSPLDLALGWGRMQDAAVLSKLRISQGGRWYHLRWSSEPPLPAGEMLESSSNMHMVPADDAIA
ncbi:MAG TPA: hypothetical protein VFN09_02405, partial [Rhodanobacteraceae bacterium]|nr:hypothetical protein [Rhodanobacteraceae bacterium]